MKDWDDFVVQNNHKVLSPLEVKEGMSIYSLFRDRPFKVRNRWLILKIDNSWGCGPRAFCVLLYGRRAYTPGQTTKWFELSSLPRNEWRML